MAQKQLSLTITGTIMGGPRLAQMLKEKQEEWDAMFPASKPSLWRQQPKKRRLHKILRWVL